MTTPDQPTPPKPVTRAGFPIVPVMGMVNGIVCSLCLTAMYIVRQWRLAREAEIEAAERVALMTRGKDRGRWRGRG
jgi:hypothetical protein